MDFTLEPAQAEWVQETFTKVMDELKQTAPNGRAFSDTVSAILEREKNWVKWKNELCTAFDKEPWSAEIDGRTVGLEEATRELRQKMREPSDEWPWRLGSEPLTEIWDMGYRNLLDLQNPFQCVGDFRIRRHCTENLFRPGDVKDFLKKIQLEDRRIAMRQEQLAKLASAAKARSAAAAAAQAKIKAEADVTMESVPPTAPDEARPAAPNPAGSPIHPSLPAKPEPTAAAAEIQPAVVAPTPTPAATPAPAPPPPVTDDQIIKHEEV